MSRHLTLAGLGSLVCLGLFLGAARAQQSPARLVVKLPADAVLTVAGYQVKQIGPERLLITPPLLPGPGYTYTLVARWTADGKPLSAERVVAVEAGKETVVDFGTPAQAGTPEAGAPKAGTPKSREFLFTYGATVTGLKPGQTAKIWLPVPQTTKEQEIKVAFEKLPAKGVTGTEPKFGNKILFLEAKADDSGTIPLAITYRVKRYEVKGDSTSPPVTRKEVEEFLKPDKMVPVSGKCLVVIEGKKLPEDDQMMLGKALYDIVNDHMTYSKKGTGWGRGDSEWACDSRYGNCTDFHSLFISLARSKKVPAKFEIGFPIPAKRGQGEVGGYHCWAKFKPEGKNWVPVDISEANQAKAKNPEMVDYLFGNLTENRVTFTEGRDINLVPRQAGEPLNYFIYPYVEVEGKALPADRVQRKFGYQDVN